MSDSIDELFSQARESGEVPDTWLDRIQKASEASGLRKDLSATKAQRDELVTQNNSLRAGLLGDRFTALGITLKPSVLNIPADLDPTDPDKVSAWATEMGLISAVTTTTTNERSAHDRIASASNTGNGVPTLTAADLVNINSEEEFWSKAGAIEAARRR